MVDKVVVVTGGAAGIGRAAVELFAERGFGVVVLDVSEAGLADVARIDNVVPLLGDAADEQANRSLVALALEHFGRLDVALLNAGIGGAPAIEQQGSVERFERLLAVNATGVARGIRAAVPALRASGGGSIVVTSSVSALAADPSTWAYNASKAAAVNLVRAAALDYAAQGIRVNAVAAGLTDTSRTAGHQDDTEFYAELLRRIPVHRPALPREQAEAIWFLASPAASYITGSVLSVDGGLGASTGLLPPPPLPGGPQA
ncbi:SDR family NAD(P)-dependent oxidoreductase [Kitasatospora sp. NPDC057223]|uniref:SDR family NAD(P)-dependent oxidoreductase n=1 Tax=Kitasatospora sp. NPDC057223 TaxID=3346055 RepID=UPI0036397E6B